MEISEPSPNFQFPPGFRFHPSDEELITHYLRNKVASRPIPAAIIAEIDLYKFNPWELPKKALFGEDEWYFFSPRDRKYPNGARPNRAAGSGYWKATGTDRPILTCSGSKSIGVKKALVFYSGRPPKGIKTDWIMNEYRLPDSTIKPARAKGSMRLDDWVLCRVRQKGSMSKNAYEVKGNNNKDFTWQLPRMEEACHSYTSYNTNMITDCLNKDCRLLASILAEQALPPIHTISCVSNQESSKKDSIFNSVYEVGSEKMNSSPIIVSSFDNYNPFRRNTNEEERCDNLLQANRLSETCGDKNYYCQNQSQYSLYNPSVFDLSNGFPELNELALCGKYIEQ